MSSIDNQQCTHCEVDFYTAGRGDQYKHLCASCNADRVERETAEQEQQEMLQKRLNERQQQHPSFMCNECRHEFENAYRLGLEDGATVNEQRAQQAQEAATVASLVAQLQACLDGSVQAAGVQEVLREGRGLLARWHKEGRQP